MKRKILLVEDEPGLVLTLSDRLANEGYEAETAGDGDAGLERASNESFDLLILDLMLPKRSGIDVCRKLRQNGNDVPILMLTARGQLAEKVLGFEAGADDYLTKPFEMLELLARIEALLRRVARSGSEPKTPTAQFGRVKVDFRRTEVTRDDHPVSLSAREFQLLEYLVEHRGFTLSREELLTKVWGYSANTSTRTVDVHMAWLRQKLEDDPKNPRYLLTVRGLGYKFGE